MARARAQTISLAMYRHFAVGTLVLTATIAMFASGGVSPIEQRVEQEQKRAATGGKPEKGTPPLRDARRHKPSWASDEGGTGPAGEPHYEIDSDTTVAFAQDGDIVSDLPAGLPDGMVGAAPPGMPSDLSREIGGTPARKAAPRKPTPAEIARLAEASRDRSGAGDGI